MRKTIAALVAGIVLGTTGTGIAASQAYWHGNGSGYDCEGISSGVVCKAGGYSVGVTPDFVFVQKRGSKQTFACRKWRPFSGCLKG